MSWYGLGQGLQYAAVTRDLAAEPDRFEGRSRYNSLSPSGRPSGCLAAGEGPVQLRNIFSLRTLLSVPCRSP